MLDTPDFDKILELAHSPIFNYIIPGLNSYLISDVGDKGKIRLFHSTRNHQENVTPHSHRFDFQCLVLRGHVKNKIWKMQESEDSDLYQLTQIEYLDSPGQYKHELLNVNPWEMVEDTFYAGDWYQMQHDQIHSISFSKNSFVLFFEGPTITKYSVYIEPFVDGKLIKTFKVEDWMFQRKI